MIQKEDGVEQSLRAARHDEDVSLPNMVFL